MKDSLHVEAVGGAGLIVSTALEIIGEFAGSAVLYNSRIALVDGVCKYSY